MRFLTDDQRELLVQAGHDYACSGINEDAVRQGGRPLCAALDRATALIKAERTYDPGYPALERIVAFWSGVMHLLDPADCRKIRSIRSATSGSAKPTWGVYESGKMTPEAREYLEGLNRRNLSDE